MILKDSIPMEGGQTLSLDDALGHLGYLHERAYCVLTAMIYEHFNFSEDRAHREYFILSTFDRARIYSDILNDYVEQMEVLLEKIRTAVEQAPKTKVDEAN